MGKFSSTWSLMGASWQVLKKDKEILVFPLISGICCLVVLASFAIPIIAGGAWRHPGGNSSTTPHVVYYAVLFLFYFCNYLVIVFFNAAIVACATMRMEGGDPTVSYGLQAALARLPLIAGWALVSATVGLILRVIEDRSEKLGQFVAGLLGVAWTVASFLVVPILVIEKKEPLTALKDSTALLKKTWGEQLIGNFSFGFVFFLLAIPAFIFIVMGLATGRGMGVIAGIFFAAVYLTGLALIQSALQAIFQAALYLYARDGLVAPGFEEGLLINAMIKR
jgi:Family of unknown function (DUF6159)